MRNMIGLVIASVLVFGGLALVLPGAAAWNALQIQAGLGDPAPLIAETSKMAVGMVCLAVGWFLLKGTKNLG